MEARGLQRSEQAECSRSEVGLGAQRTAQSLSPQTPQSHIQHGGDPAGPGMRLRPHRGQAVPGVPEESQLLPWHPTSALLHSTQRCNAKHTPSPSQTHTFPLDPSACALNTQHEAVDPWSWCI